MPLDPAILEQLASRICHDLISPVGAIGNGLELLVEMGVGEGSEEAVKLIAYSAAQAAAKLQAFRLAYGAGGRDPNIKPEDVLKTFGKYIAGDGKIRQAWDPYGPLGIDVKTPCFCKMLMISLLLAAETLPRGGLVFVDAGDGPETFIRTEGQDAVVRDGVERAIAGDIPADDIDPRLVHPVMCGVLARKHGFKIDIREKTDGKVLIALTYLGGI
jgi:histidine phosphotransferase ChpT